jgi:ribonuclease P protein component
MSAAGSAAEAPERGEPEGLRLPRSSRIRSAREIRDLHARGKRKRTPHLDVFFAASPASHSRLGVVVPKHRRRIVDRNRLRRRLREIGRTELLPRLRRDERALDVLIRARPEAYEAPFADLRRELVALVDDVEGRWLDGS